MTDFATQPWAVVEVMVLARERALPIGVLRPPVGPDAPSIDRLLRLSLTTRRRGATLRVTRIHPDLRDLVELFGVTDQLGIP